MSKQKSNKNIIIIAIVSIILICSSSLLGVYFISKPKPAPASAPAPAPAKAPAPAPSKAPTPATSKAPAPAPATSKAPAPTPTPAPAPVAQKTKYAPCPVGYKDTDVSGTCYGGYIPGCDLDCEKEKCAVAKGKWQDLDPMLNPYTCKMDPIP